MTASTSSVPAGELCGVWIDGEGVAHLSSAAPDGGREERTDAFQPFAWLGDAAAVGGAAGVAVELLKGEGPFRWLAHAKTRPAFEAFVREAPDGAPIDWIRPLESQYLLARRRRLFGELAFAQIRRCQLDIETGHSTGGFSDARNPGDRVLAIGLQFGSRQRLLILQEETDGAEIRLLLEFNDVIEAEDPDVIEGHNLFKFDLEYLRLRCRLYRLPCAWGRFGQPASFRNSRLKVAERWIDFPRCDLPGRAVVDIYLLVQLHDISTREMLSYGLKDVAIHFGITDEGGKRAHLYRGQPDSGRVPHRSRPVSGLSRRRSARDKGCGGPAAADLFRTGEDLSPAAAGGDAARHHQQDRLAFPRGVLPCAPELSGAAGGAAVRGRLHAQLQGGRVPTRVALRRGVALPEPSAVHRRNPRDDSLGVFIPLLTRLREYRLKYKQLARTAATEELRAEYQARQASFKILINSFYGYLGFSGARFGDGDLAAEVTRQGRELLQKLIDEFARNGCSILEADTDGIYLSSEQHFAEPEKLLLLVSSVLPPGIELEFDGRYDAMFCYKAKNYALYDGHTIILRGSAPCARAASSRTSGS